MTKWELASLVLNYFGKPLLAKIVPSVNRLAMDYGELMGFIEGYTTRSNICGQFVFESHSLLVIKTLSLNCYDYYELGALSSYFLHIIDSLSIVFSHLYRSGNSSAHHLPKSAHFLMYLCNGVEMFPLM